MALAVTFLLAGCSLFETEVEPPPRATDPIEVPDGSSTVTANINIDLTDLRRALEREVPRRLWSLNQPGAECIASQRTEVIGIALKSPTIKCDLTGQVTRGSLTLSGEGRDLVVTMPIRATLAAKDIAGIIEQETANARARVSARVRLSVDDDWSTRGRVRIRYHWTEPPAVELLGQKLTFASEADGRLARVVRNLEQSLQAEIARLDLRSQLEPVWESGFTVLSLNRKNPPVWLRLTPSALRYKGYSASHDTLAVKMRLDATTQVFVGDRPEPSPATPLPTMSDDADGAEGVMLALPVIAQYSEIEPVVRRALEKRAERAIALPALGDRMFAPRSVTAYGTTGNRIALGVEFEAWKPGKRDDAASGTVWLTARPSNASNSRKVAFLEPDYLAETSRFSSNVLLEIAKTRDFSATIEDALTQNFESDYRELLQKVDRAIERQRIGDFEVVTQLDKVSTGSLKAYGEALVLPVSAQGTAQIRYAPRSDAD